MFKNSIIKIGFLSTALILLIGCLKNENFPPEPVLELKSITMYGTDAASPDSAWIIFDFTDGDGDIGTSDTTGNCFVKYFEKNGDTVTAFPEFDRKLTLPNLTPEAKNKALKGEMHIVIEPAPIFNFKTDSAFKWELYIIDRAGNKSNTLSSPFYDKKNLIVE